MSTTLQHEQVLHFRDELREARAAALKDAEGFMELLRAIESLGEYRNKSAWGLGRYKKKIAAIADASSLAVELPRLHARFHTPFNVLYDLVHDGRNLATHYGSYARNLTDKAVELSLIIEDGLMEDCHLARDFMVSNPVCAELWQPLSFCRQRMLMNAFSFLPVLTDGHEQCVWRLLSDRSLARFLRVADEQGDRRKARRKRLAIILKDAYKQGLLDLEPADCFGPATPVDEITKRIGDRPVLVVDPEDERRLHGIITAFDLL